MTADQIDALAEWILAVLHRQDPETYPLTVLPGRNAEAKQPEAARTI